MTATSAVFIAYWHEIRDSGRVDLKINKLVTESSSRLQVKSRSGYRFMGPSCIMCKLEVLQFQDISFLVCDYVVKAFLFLAADCCSNIKGVT